MFMCFTILRLVRLVLTAIPSDWSSEGALALYCTILFLFVLLPSTHSMRFPFLPQTSHVIPYRERLIPAKTHLSGITWLFFILPQHASVPFDASSMLYVLRFPRGETLWSVPPFSSVCLPQTSLVRAMRNSEVHNPCCSITSSAQCTWFQTRHLVETALKNVLRNQHPL